MSCPRTGIRIHVTSTAALRSTFKGTFLHVLPLQAGRSSPQQDRSIAVWDMVSPTEINLRRVLVGHRAAVNVVDFDEKYIVSASGDRTIKVRPNKTRKVDNCIVPLRWHSEET